jgi:hypothetical protein
MGSGALVVVALAASVAAGCDPAFTMQGRVRSGAAALEGAEIALACEDGARPLGTTDARGKLAYHSIPGESPDCRVTVTKAGYATRSFRLAELCTGHFGVTCTRAMLAVELVPTSR